MIQLQNNFIQAWEPKETKYKISIVKLSVDQAQVMQDKALLKLKET